MLDLDLTKKMAGAGENSTDLERANRLRRAVALGVSDGLGVGQLATIVGPNVDEVEEWIFKLKYPSCRWCRVFDRRDEPVGGVIETQTQTRGFAGAIRRVVLEDVVHAEF